jgi:DNA-binding response OmpR family regulator
VRVLIVDDEESARLLNARILSHDLAVEVQLAGTCEHALRLAEQYTYDAILLDLMMPGIGGYAVLYAVRRTAANADTPVIVVSSDKDAIERCMAAGADAFHVKPVKRAELVEIVRAHLGSRRKAKAR